VVEEGGERERTAESGARGSGGGRGFSNGPSVQVDKQLMVWRAATLTCGGWDPVCRETFWAVCAGEVDERRRCVLVIRPFSLILL
jgi:hypothetical protein